MPFQQTLAILKPDAVARPVVGAILAMAEAAGLRIAAMEMRRLDENTARAIYAEHAGKDWLPDQIAYMLSGPVVAVILEGEDAIARWRAVMGPTDHTKAPEGTVRRGFALSYRENSVHGSDSPASAAREIAILFPNHVAPDVAAVPGAAAKRGPAACFAVIPDDQRISFRVVPAPGRLLRASMVGGQIRAIARLLKAGSDRRKDGRETDVFVSGIWMDDEGAVTVETVTLPEAAS